MECGELRDYMRLSIGRIASVKFKSLVMYFVTFAIVLGGVNFFAPQFFGQVAHAAGGTWSVDVSFSDIQCVSSKQCKTIQAAINAASSEDTINVAAGTYYEDIQINKSLTIDGAGPDATILNGNSATENYYMVSIEADNVTVENLAITNPLYTGTSDASGILTANAGAKSNLHISHVKIHDIGTLTRTDPSGNGTYGINSGPVNGMEIDNTEIYNIGTGNPNSLAFGILLWGNSTTETANNVNIHDNNIHNIQNIGNTGGIDAGGDASDITINQNIVTGPFSAYGGIRTSGSMDGFATITNNTVTGASSAGIILCNPFTQTVTGNTVSGAMVGIQVNATSTTAPTINFNRILGNTMGLNNLSSNVVDATSNWWGAISGPGIVGSGTGDNVSTHVDYKPWCTDSGCTTFSSANPTTTAATDMTSSDTTLNGTNGSYDATGHSFWVSTNHIDTSSSNIPSGVYSTYDMGIITANTNFTTSLSSLTTSGVPSKMSAITPNTTYYYVAWSEVDGTLYPGEVKSFTTASIPDTTPPVITLTGSSSMLLNNGESYVEPGATINEGTLVRTGSVNTSVAGVYTITYTVTDAAGNVSIAYRTVTVKAADKPVVSATTLGGGQVLGDEVAVAVTDTTKEPETKGEVKGTSDVKKEDAPWYDAAFMGLAWYWWVVLAIAAGGLGWWAFGAIRNRNQN